MLSKRHDGRVDIKIKTTSIGSESGDLDNPLFVKIATKELEEIGRKLDILRDLKGGQGELIRGQEENIGLQ